MIFFKNIAGLFSSGNGLFAGEIPTPDEVYVTTDAGVYVTTDAGDYIIL